MQYSHSSVNGGEKNWDKNVIFMLLGFHFILWCLVVNIKIAQAPDTTLCCSSFFFLSRSLCPFKSLRKQVPLSMRFLVFLSEIRQCVKASDLSAEKRTVKCQAGKEGEPLLGVLVTSVCYFRCLRLLSWVSEWFVLFIWCSRPKEKVSWGDDHLHWMAMIPEEVKKSNLLLVSASPKTHSQPRS